MGVLATLEREAASTREQVTKLPANRRTWKRTFFRSLAEHGNVSQAARDANVARRWVFKLKADDPRFARRFARAMQDADRAIVDRAEAALADRAINGRTRTVIKDGKPIEVEDKPSDKCLEMLLKARRPKRYDRNRGASSVTVNVDNRQQTQLAMLANPELAELVCRMDALMSRPNALPQEG